MKSRPTRIIILAACLILIGVCGTLFVFRHALIARSVERYCLKQCSQLLGGDIYSKRRIREGPSLTLEGLQVKRKDVVMAADSLSLKWEATLWPLQVTFEVAIDGLEAEVEKMPLHLLWRAIYKDNGKGSVRLAKWVMNKARLSIPQSDEIIVCQCSMETATKATQVANVLLDAHLASNEQSQIELKLHWSPFTKEGKGNLTISELPINLIPYPKKIAGQLNGVTSVTLNGEAPVFNGNFAIEDLLIDHLWGKNLVGEFSSHNSELKVKTSIDRGNVGVFSFGSLDAVSNMKLSSKLDQLPQELQSVIDIHDLVLAPELGPLSGHVEYKNNEWLADLEGKLRFQAIAKAESNLWRIHGEAWLNQDAYQLNATMLSDLSIQEGHIKGEKVALQPILNLIANDANQVKIDGLVNLDGDIRNQKVALNIKPINLAIKLKEPEVWIKLPKNNTSTGTVNFDRHGNRLAWIELKDAGVSSPYLTKPIESLSANIEVYKDGFKAKKIWGTIGKSTFKASAIGVSGHKGYDLYFMPEKFQGNSSDLRVWLKSCEKICTGDWKQGEIKFDPEKSLIALHSGQKPIYNLSGTLLFEQIKNLPFQIVLNNLSSAFDIKSEAQKYRLYNLVSDVKHPQPLQLCVGEAEMSGNTLTFDAWLSNTHQDIVRLIGHAEHNHQDELKITVDSAKSHIGKIRPSHLSGTVTTKGELVDLQLVMQATLPTWKEEFYQYSKLGFYPLKGLEVYLPHEGNMRLGFDKTKDDFTISLLGDAVNSSLFSDDKVQAIYRSNGSLQFNTQDIDVNGIINKNAHEITFEGAINFPWLELGRIKIFAKDTEAIFDSEDCKLMSLPCQKIKGSIQWQGDKLNLIDAAIQSGAFWATCPLATINMKNWLCHIPSVELSKVKLKSINQKYLPLNFQTISLKNLSIKADDLLTLTGDGEANFEPTSDKSSQQPYQLFLPTSGKVEFIVKDGRIILNEARQLYSTGKLAKINLRESIEPSHIDLLNKSLNISLAIKPSMLRNAKNTNLLIWGNWDNLKMDTEGLNGSR